MRHRYTAAVMVLGACLFGGALVNRAMAQRVGHYGGVGISDLKGEGTNRIDVKLLERYVKTLQLDAAQREAAFTLHSAYEAAGKTIDKRANDVIDSLQEEADATSLQAIKERMPELMNTAREQRDVAARQLLDDLRSLLTKEQEARWPMLERQRRRETKIGPDCGLLGGVSGTGIDLLFLIEGLRLPEAELASVQPELEAYTVEVDRIVRQQQQADIEMTKQMERDYKTGIFDQDAFNAGRRAVRDRGIELRNMNRRYVREVGTKLSDEWRDILEETYQRKAMPVIFKETLTGRGLNAVAKFKDLSAEQRVAITELRTEYLKRVTPLNARWADELFSAETLGKTVMVPTPGEAGENDSLAAAHAAKKAFDTEFSPRLRAILNEEQRARLPKKILPPDYGGGIPTRPREEDMGD